MTAAKKINPTVAALRKVEASVDQHLNARPGASAKRLPKTTPARTGSRRLLRKFVLYAGAAAGILLVGFGALWWRLGAGPIALDLVTPWLAAAIEENFGTGHRGEIGGTQIERDDSGRPA